MEEIRRLLESDDPADRKKAFDMLVKDAEPKPVDEERERSYSMLGIFADVVTDAASWFLPFGPQIGITFKKKDKKPALTVDQIVVESKRFDHSLKKTFGRVILWLVIVQVLISNIIILSHFFGGIGNTVEPTVLVAWISGTVIESIGLMTVVTKYLFNPAASDKSEPG